MAFTDAAEKKKLFFFDYLSFVANRKSGCGINPSLAYFDALDFENRLLRVGGIRRLARVDFFLCCQML